MGNDSSSNNHNNNNKKYDILNFKAFSLYLVLLYFLAFISFIQLIFNLAIISSNYYGDNLKENGGYRSSNNSNSNNNFEVLKLKKFYYLNLTSDCFLLFSYLYSINAFNLRKYDNVKKSFYFLLINNLDFLIYLLFIYLCYVQISFFVYFYNLILFLFNLWLLKKSFELKTLLFEKEDFNYNKNNNLISSLKSNKVLV